MQEVRICIFLLQYLYFFFDLHFKFYPSNCLSARVAGLQSLYSESVVLYEKLAFVFLLLRYLYFFFHLHMHLVEWPVCNHFIVSQLYFARSSYLYFSSSIFVFLLSFAFAFYLSNCIFDRVACLQSLYSESVVLCQKLAFVPPLLQHLYSNFHFH